MRLAEQGRKRHDKYLSAEIIADVQQPIAPIVIAGRHRERAHDASGVIVRLGQVAHAGAASIDQCDFGVAAMEIDVSHVPTPASAK
jgi:hypothetical protein